MYDIIVLSGISGAGKSYFIQHAIEKYDWLCQIPSVTTREVRDGIDETATRVFVDERSFDDEKKKGNLLFSNTIYGRKYAYRKLDILNSIQAGKTVILDMKLDAVKDVRDVFPKTFCIYIKVKLQDIKKEIGLERNNLELRMEDAAEEQRKVDTIPAFAEKADIIFENTMDWDSVDRFMDLISMLR